ncbi:Hypothetical predicted protein, partial [Paramuricea clavata]
MAIRNLPNTDSGVSPAQLVVGEQLHMPGELNLPADDANLDVFARKLNDAIKTQSSDHLDKSSKQLSSHSLHTEIDLSLYNKRYCVKWSQMNKVSQVPAILTLTSYSSLVVAPCLFVGLVSCCCAAGGSVDVRTTTTLYCMPKVSITVVTGQHHCAITRLADLVRGLRREIDSGISPRVAALRLSRLSTYIEVVEDSLHQLCDVIDQSGSENAQDVIDQTRSSAALAISSADVVLLDLEALSESSVDLLPPRPAVPPKERIKIDIRPFDQREPTLWFDLLEAQFRAAGIDSEQGKFAYLVKFLDDSQSYQVGPIVAAGSADMYSQAKTLLVRLYSLSRPQRIQRAFFEETLGNHERLADFLARISPLCEELTPDDVKKFLMARQLPSSVRQQMVERFDEVSSGQFQESADRLLADLRHQEVRKTIRPDQGDHSSSGVAAVSSRGRARGAGSQGPKGCVFHQAYGDKARSCKGGKCPFWSSELQRVKVSE